MKKNKQLIKKICVAALCTSVLGFGIATVVGQNKPAITTSAASDPDLVIDSDQAMDNFIDACNAGTNYDGKIIHLTNDVEVTLTKKPSNSFAGTFYGNSHTITVHIDTTDSATGIWRNINGTVRDFNLAGDILNSSTFASPLAVYNNGTIRNVVSSVTADLPTVDYVSGLIFRNNSGGVISTCEFTGNITGKKYVGGITSDNMRYIGYCTNSGSVNGTQYVGGITATMDKSNSLNDTSKLQLTHCTNNGKVTGENAGGLASYISRGSINNSTNEYDFTGVTNFGGFVYEISGGEISDCSNNGDLSGTEILAGIAYLQTGGEISNCSNTGNITVTGSYASGIVYKVSGGTLTNSYNSGAVSGVSRLAGVAAYYEGGSISLCSNNGGVTGTSGYIGGIISIMGTFDKGSGASVDITLSKCVNKASISGTSDCGGIAGYAYPNVKLLYCSNYGTITSTSTGTGIGTGGIVGRISNACTTQGAQTLIRYCYNGGRIVAGTLAGGILGLVATGTTPVVELTDNLTTGFVECTRTKGNANVGTLVGYANTVNVSNSWAIAGYSVNSGVSKNTYGYGIGAGDARSTLSSKATSSSDEFRYVIQFIREYSCSEDTTTFKTKYNGLLAAEKALLDEVYYYDNLTGSDPRVFDQTYKQAACYIAGEPYSNVNSVLLMFTANEQNTTWTIILVITAILVSSTVIGIVIIKKRRFTY